MCDYLKREESGVIMSLLEDCSHSEGLTPKAKEVYGSILWIVVLIAWFARRFGRQILTFLENANEMLYIWPCM